MGLFTNFTAVGTIVNVPTTTSTTIDHFSDSIFLTPNLIDQLTRTPGNLSQSVFDDQTPTPIGPLNRIIQTKQDLPSFEDKSCMHLVGENNISDKCPDWDPLVSRGTTLARES